MRRKLFILVACSFLVAATELHELARLPFLVVHYYHHQAQNTSLSMNDFLRLHYQGTHPADNDDTDDKQLPFKSGKDIIHTDIPAVIPSFIVNLPSLTGNDRQQLLYPEGVPLHRAYSIFHPPRYC